MIQIVKLHRDVLVDKDRRIFLYNILYDLLQIVRFEYQIIAHIFVPGISERHVHIALDLDQLLPARDRLHLRLLQQHIQRCDRCLDLMRPECEKVLVLLILLPALSCILIWLWIVLYLPLPPQKLQICDHDRRRKHHKKESIHIKTILPVQVIQDGNRDRDRHIDRSNPQIPFYLIPKTMLLRQCIQVPASFL